MNYGRLGLLVWLLAAPVAAQDCVGDCNCDRAVTVDEITGLTMVALNGGRACDCGACPSGGIAVPCIVTAIDNAMQGCRQLACVGDCDGDGSVTEIDIDLCLADLTIPEAIPPQCCDANRDGQVSADELIAITSRLGTSCPR